MSALTAEASAPANRDPIHRLPPEAQSKLIDLRDRVDQAFDLQRAESTRVDEARRNYRKAADSFRQLEEAYKQGTVTTTTRVREMRGDGLDFLVLNPKERIVQETRRVRPDENRLARERAEVARLEKEWIRRREALENLVARSGGLSELRQNLEDWLNTLPRTTEIRLHSRRPQASKGDPLSKIDEFRTQIIALREELEDLIAAPHPAEEIKAACRDQISALARHGQPNIEPALDLGEVEFPSRDVLLHTVLASGGTGVVRGGIPDAMAFIAWLFRDDLIARLNDVIEERADPEGAISQTERENRMTEIARRILAVERKEVATIDGAAVSLEYRPNTDPRAFFNLADDLPASTGEIL